MNQTNSDGQEFRNSLRRSLIPTGKDLLQWASYAGGFALITVLSALFTQRALLWPLIPAGLTAVVGGAAVEVMEVVGRYWPVLFIALGIAVIIEQVMGNREEA